MIIQKFSAPAGGGLLAALDCYQNNGEALDTGGVNVTAASITHGTGHDAVEAATVIIDSNSDNYYFACNESNGLINGSVGSIQVWFKAASDISSGHIFAQSTDNGTLRAYRNVLEDSLVFTINSSNATITLGAEDIWDGSWYQLTFTWNQSASSRKIYIGSNEYSSGTAWTDADISAGNIWIGNRMGNFAQSGNFQDFKVYDSEITP